MASTAPASKKQGGQEGEQPKSKRGRPVMASDPPIIDLYVLSCTTPNNFLHDANDKGLKVYEQDQHFTVYTLACYPGAGRILQIIRAKLFDSCIEKQKQCVAGSFELELSFVIFASGLLWAQDKRT